MHPYIKELIIEIHLNFRISVRQSIDMYLSPRSQNLAKKKLREFENGKLAINKKVILKPKLKEMTKEFYKNYGNCDYLHWDEKDEFLNEFGKLLEEEIKLKWVWKEIKNHLIDIKIQECEKNERINEI